MRRVVFAGVLILLAASCAITPKKSIPLFNALDLDAKIKAGNLVNRFDNFIIILDASDSMNELYKNETKFFYAKSLLAALNQTIPNLKMNCAIRTYGKGNKDSSQNKTQLQYGVTQYNKADFANAITGIPDASGINFIQAAILAGAEDLKSYAGKSAMIVISDGKMRASDSDPALTVKTAKGFYGDRLCVFPIFIPSNTADIRQVEKDKGVMKKIAEAGVCGFYSEAEKLFSPEAMADFVTQVFLSTSNDTDGDGVFDDKDKCPNTPFGVKVDDNGCPLDSDGDGVPDYLDKCPDTAKGLKVDSSGCPAPVQPVTPTQPAAANDADGDGVSDANDKCPHTPKGVTVDETGCWIIQNILFEFDQWSIKSNSYSILDHAAEAIRATSDIEVILEGNTCNIGPKQYNQTLSEKRAESVKAYLLKKGVEPKKLKTVGFGFDKPVAPNNSEVNRKKNRRVEIKQSETR